jgi:hypothetical protein
VVRDGARSGVNALGDWDYRTITGKKASIECHAGPNLKRLHFYLAALGGRSAARSRSSCSSQRWPSAALSCPTTKNKKGGDWTTLQGPEVNLLAVSMPVGICTAVGAIVRRERWRWVALALVVIFPPVFAFVVLTQMTHWFGHQQTTRQGRSKAVGCNKGCVSRTEGEPMDHYDCQECGGCCVRVVLVPMQRK